MTDFNFLNDPVILGICIFILFGILLIFSAMISGSGKKTKRPKTQHEKIDSENDGYKENRKNRFAQANLKRFKKKLQEQHEEQKHKSHIQEVQLEKINAQKEQIKAAEAIIDAKEIKLQAGVKEIYAQGKIIESNKILNAAERKELEAKMLLISAERQNILALQAKVIVEREKLDLLHREKVLEINNYKSRIQDLLKEFNYEKANWNLQRKKEQLDIYSREIKLLKKTVDDTYEFQKRDLSLREKLISTKAERLDLRKEKNEIQRLYKQDRLLLRELETRRGELRLFEKELHRKMLVISTGEDGMYMRKDISTQEAYLREGYYPSSPLIEEVEYLKTKIRELRQLLPHE